MQDLKSEYVITLAKLLLKGAKDNFIEFTSTDIGIEINKSQQAASKIILELQEMKYVERVKKGHGYMIRVTEEGLSAVKKMSEFLYMALDSSPGNVHFNGTLVSGMGEGINGNENIQSDLLILERTHHDNDMLEIIAPVNIKQVLHLKNGDDVKVTLQTSKNKTESYVIN